MLQTNHQIKSTTQQAIDEFTGLSSVNAAKRLKLEGFNELPNVKERSLFHIIVEIIKEPMFALLIGGGVVYFLLGNLLDALFLMVFAFLSVAITIVQESRSEKVLEALRNLASPRAMVMRDGLRVHIAGREVVREDLMVISEGDRVAADATLISSQDLLLDESLLTGESVAVPKVSVPKLKPQLNAEQNIKPSAATTNSAIASKDSSTVFAGSLVVRGTGVAVVIATGVRSEMGKIGHSLQSIETQQPQLNKQLSGLVRNFALIGSVATILTVTLFWLLRGSWLQALLGGIALGMSLLPAEFPMILAVFMAMGAWRISKVRVLTRRTSAIESLGAVTVLCTDKTGTLTENKMTVVAIQAENETWVEAIDLAITPSIQIVLKTALLACAEQPSDPMDIAIHQLAALKIGTNVESFKNYKLVRAYGLKPECFAVANIWIDGDENACAYTKGALETIAEICHLPASQLTSIQKQAEALAQNGIRVLGVAKSTINTAQLKALPETLHDIKFDYVGLIGFADPLRTNVPAAVAECRAAGIKVVMITGDYPITAKAIGQQAGIDSAHVLNGDAIEIMTDEALTIALKTTSIFARIRPNQKLRLVQLLKKQGDIVAMTGDGVNDAPAIKAADIGIAMGGRGTDVAREASHLVLLDDDFGSIVNTIQLGRRIYDNLRKAIEFIIAAHIPIAGLAIMPLLLGLPLMLAPIHIVFLEMIINPACSIVFEAESAEKDAMKQPPRNPKSPLVLRKRVIWALVQGLMVLAVLAILLMHAVNLKMPKADLRTLVFTSLVILNMGLILINRSFSASVYSALLKPNRSLWILLSTISAVLAIIVSWQPAKTLFHFGQFHWHLFAISLAASIGVLILMEAIKSQLFKRKDFANLLPVSK